MPAPIETQPQVIQHRKSSKDGEDNIIVVSTPPEDGDPQPHGSAHGIVGPASLSKSPGIVRNGVPPPLRRGHGRSASVAGHMNGIPVSSPLRNTFTMPQTNGVNGHQQPSPYRPSFPAINVPNGHSRTRSTASTYSPSLPSPLAHTNGFPHSPIHSSALPSSTTLPNMPLNPNHNRLPPSPGLLSAQSAPGGMYNQYMQSPTSPTSPYLPLDSGPPTTNGSNPATTAAQHKRRHSRMHSRNLSVFFPRPGSLPHSTIDEDGGQELEIPNDYEAPVSTIPSAGSSINIPGSRAKVPLTPLGQGFKFGGRPPPSASEGSDLSAGPADDDQEFSLPRGPKRRGHHHKHSVSHNFFSFLDPTGPTTSDGAQPELHLHTQPTPMPQSPWAPMSAFPDSAKPNGAFPATPSSQVYTPTWDTSASQPEVISTRAAAFGLGQFLLGAWMWVAGQQIGSLSCTGLGYWIVFDAFGVAVSRVVPGWLASSSGSAQEMERLKIRRPYGNGRLETVLIFSQAVYLMFSSVYVCKETVEHLLLSAGGEGHHHHSGDEQAHAAINFPVFVIFLTLISLLATAILYDNNTKLVNLAGNRLPSIQSLIRSLQSKPNTHYIEPPPTHPVAIILSNPYVACPLLFCVAILSVALTVPSEHHRIADLTLASVIAVLTFNVAYRACVILGAVLLQTSPRRGLPSGKIESFLRAMREIERHPHVVHLSAPHVWQLTASTAALQHTSTSAATISPSSTKSPSAFRKTAAGVGQTDQLVVTVEVHVRKDLGDDDVLALTKWVWERCVNALGGYKEFREVGEVGGPEITVGVVRG